MKNISKKIVVCFIACFVIASLSSCDEIAKKAYKEVAEEFVEEGAEKGVKKSSKKVLKQVNGRPLPDNSTVLTDVGRKKLQRETGLSANACKHIRTEEQAEILRSLKFLHFFQLFFSSVSIHSVHLNLVINFLYSFLF